MSARSPIVLVCIAALLWATSAIDSDPVCVVLAWLTPPPVVVALGPVAHDRPERLPIHTVRLPLPSRAPPAA